MARGRVGDYARYQLRDYLVERGASTLVLGALVMLVPVALGGPESRGAAPALFTGALGSVALIGAIFALNGISSTDRQRGYFRFLFSKPVSVVRYYAQDLALRGVGLLGVSLVLFAAFALLTRGPVPLWALAYVALAFALVGGVGFLLAAITHHDGIALVGVLVATTLVRAGSTLLGWMGRGPVEALQFVSTVLPPFHLLDPARDALARGAAPPVGLLVWVLAYGLGSFGAGLLVLRHRPLAT
jgi:hypothetical protein